MVSGIQALHRINSQAMCLAKLMIQTRPHKHLFPIYLALVNRVRQHTTHSLQQSSRNRARVRLHQALPGTHPIFSALHHLNKLRPMYLASWTLKRMLKASRMCLARRRLLMSLRRICLSLQPTSLVTLSHNRASRQATFLARATPTTIKRSKLPH